MALTDLQIKKLVPRSDRFEIVDGKGLSIRVMPTGKKSWIFRYTLDGIRHRMTLGSYPSITLAEVRELHARALQEVDHSIDPSLKQKQAKVKRKAAPSVLDLIEEYFDVVLKPSVSGKERLRLLTKDVLPIWGNRKVTDITRRDAVLLADDVRGRSASTGNRVQGLIAQMFNFAAERGILDVSPMAGMRSKREKARERVLCDAEIKLLWDVLALDNTTIDVYHLTKLALKMILLTGQRPGEVSGMAWAEINGGTWNIPAVRMKNREAQSVPLTGLALEIIEQARVYSGDSEFVFRSSYKDGEPITRHALSKAITRHIKEIGIEERFTPHDLRRTLRTRLAELGVSDMVAERVLGHKLQGVLAVYNRHAYELEKRQALEQWERKLRQIVGIGEPETGKIIYMTGRG